jgi:uncharacterized membrane protein
MTLLPFHILAGVLALVFGYVALYATKGATLHRRSGMVFVYAMVTLSLSGALMDAWKARSISVNVVAGLMTFYFVTTGLLTVRIRAQESLWIDRAAVAFVLMVSVLAFVAGLDMMRRGRPETAPSFIFGIVGLLAATGDIRVLRGRVMQGPRRIARHLWRMCFAMWVAAASFFWGPPRRIPEVIRIPALQAVAVLLPIVVMLYWLWRLRVKTNHSWHVTVGASPAVALERTPQAPAVKARASL